jgi:hypothetical protein
MGTSISVALRAPRLLRGRRLEVGSRVEFRSHSSHINLHGDRENGTWIRKAGEALPASAKTLSI